jgi:23S rRNA (adenine-N6)-dimethyltransferase
VAASDGRRWGWHRLDRTWADRIVAAADVAPGELVLDVGAGDGVLSEALVRVGARVVAVELHPDRARSLRRRFTGRAVKVVTADAADLRLPRRPFGVVANPPFSISMALVRRLVAPGSRLVAADIVVPRHVARRWLDGHAGGARRWGTQFSLSLGLAIPARSFHPAAGRDAVVLRIRRVTAMGDRGRHATPSPRARRDPPPR